MESSCWLAAAAAARFAPVHSAGLTDEQFERIAPLLPGPRGNTRLAQRQVLHALLYMAEQPTAQDWDALSLDSTIIQLHPDASGTRRRGGGAPGDRSLARGLVGQAPRARD